MTDTDINDRNTRLLAGLGPVLSAMGVFIHPAATILLPFALHLFTRKRPDTLVSLSALRAADLAFSVYIWLTLKDLVLIGMSRVESLAHYATEANHSLITVLLLAYLLISLTAGFVQAMRGRLFRYPLSFRIAERILIH